MTQIFFGNKPVKSPEDFSEMASSILAARPVRVIKVLDKDQIADRLKDWGAMQVQEGGDYFNPEENVIYVNLRQVLTDFCGMLEVDRDTRLSILSEVP
jgi:hypothetical protein